MSWKPVTVYGQLKCSWFCFELFCRCLSDVARFQHEVLDSIVLFLVLLKQLSKSPEILNWWHEAQKSGFLPWPDPLDYILTNTKANQILQTAWSHQAFSSLFVLSRRTPVLHFTGTECSFPATSPLQPPWLHLTLTSWDGVMGAKKVWFLQSDNV